MTTAAKRFCARVAASAAMMMATATMICRALSASAMPLGQVSLRSRAADIEPMNTM